MDHSDIKSDTDNQVQRYKLTIEYKGTSYAGWQKQVDVPSIQQAIEEAIFKFTTQKIGLTVAGRTDAGVHARGQIAHFDLTPLKREMNPYEMMKAINAHLLPQPISIIKVEPVHAQFHARFDAINKLYRYHILNRASFMTLEKDLMWHVKFPLDVETMREGAKHLLGHHDFTTFRDSECQAQSPMKTLDRLDIISQDYDGCGGQEIIFEVEGKSFLHHQVRNMVGTLSLVGRGKWKPEDIKTALEQKCRTKGGPTAPADGLYLVRIDYT